MGTTFNAQLSGKTTVIATCRLDNRSSSSFHFQSGLGTLIPDQPPHSSYRTRTKPTLSRPQHNKRQHSPVQLWLCYRNRSCYVGAIGITVPSQTNGSTRDVANTSVSPVGSIGIVGEYLNWNLGSPTLAISYPRPRVRSPGRIWIMARSTRELLPDQSFRLAR